VTNYPNGLAGSHYNIGLLLSETGELNEALAAYQRALEIRERLVRDNPTVTEYQWGLADSHYSIGNLLCKTGEPNEALASYQRALEIQERLVRDNPTVTEYQSGLASSHNNIGNLLSDTGELKEALAAYQRALEIQERLARDNPTVTEYQSAVGATLNNMATLDLENQRFGEARQKLVKAIEFQQRALVGNPNQPVYRQFLGNHYINLAAAAEGLKDGALLLQARRGMAELARDPDGELNEQFAEALNSLIWELVKQPPDAVSLEFLTEELPQLRSVVNQFPSGVYYNTLGTAEYRMGNHQAAIDACAKSLEQLPKELNLSGPHPGDLAILAMSHRQLGNAEEANKFREQFKEAMKKESFKDDPECQGFAAEVTELFSKHEQPKTPTSEASKSTSDK
jgi:tetratricopeptide (TPR) repeat protein